MKLKKVLMRIQIQKWYKYSMVTLTKSTKPVSEKSIKRKWSVIDAKDRILGRVASEISSFLIGKNSTEYVPYLDGGQNVIVINASKVKVSGKKEANKTYDRYSGYPGGRNVISYQRMKEKKPEEIIYMAVSGMLPKNKLRKLRLKRLFIYSEDQYPDKNIQI